MFAGRSLEELRSRYGARYKWLVLFTVMIGTIASILAATIVNVAVPAISRHFEVSQAQVQWVSAGFMLSVTMSMLLTPWLLQRYGLRRTYSVVVSVLSLGALAGGMAQHFWLVLAMRVVEGLAAGVLQTIPAVVIMRAFGEQGRGRALGIFGFGVVLAPAIGPSVGGVLIELYGWRSIFFVMLPFGALGLLLARRYLPVTPFSGEKPPLDWRGLLLVSITTVSLLNGLVQVQSRRDWLGPSLIALSALSLALFVRWQRRTPAPLMHIALFRSRPFAVGTLVALIYGMALFGSTYLVPVLLQIGLQYGPSDAGLVLLPAGLALAFALPVTGRLSDHWPAHWMVVGGLLLLAISFLLLATVSTSTRYFLLALWVVTGRIGLSFVLPALTLSAMNGTDRSLIPQAASIMNFMRQLGGAIGVSLAGIALDWRLGAHGVTLAAEETGIAQRIRAFDETFVGVAVVCAAAAIVAIGMRPAPALPRAPGATLSPDPPGR